MNECMRGLGSVGMVPVDRDGSSPGTTTGSVPFDSPFFACCCFSQVMIFET